MSIGHSPDIYQSTMTTGDSVVTIEWIYGEKDLGVCFTPDMKFFKHNYIIHKARLDMTPIQKTVRHHKMI